MSVQGSLLVTRHGYTTDQAPLPCGRPGHGASVACDTVEGQVLAAAAAAAEDPRPSYYYYHHHISSTHICTSSQSFSRPSSLVPSLPTRQPAIIVLYARWARQTARDNTHNSVRLVYSFLLLPPPLHKPKPVRRLSNSLLQVGEKASSRSSAKPEQTSDVGFRNRQDVSSVQLRRGILAAIRCAC